MTNGYVNPLAKISGLVAERIDQGVDFHGDGPILALGDAKILETNGAGWPGGPYMSYQLLNGPEAGRTVYVAENIKPTVRVGQTVKAGDTIATMFNGGTGIEMGWANASGGSPLSQTPEAGSISGANLPAGGTEVGRSFESLLRSLGVPAGNNLSSTPGGKLPAGFTASGASPTTVPANAGGSTGGGGGGGGGLLSWPGEIVSFFNDALKFVVGVGPDGNARTSPPWGGIMWMMEPSNWVRIIAFIVGVGLLLFAVHALIAAAKGEPLIKMPETLPVPVPI